MKRRITGLVLILCILLPMFAIGASAATTTSISQFGITWTFSEAVECGQFANGDYWVVGPVTITSITPATTVVDGASMHGSMINPPISTNNQGFDSRIGDGNTYNPDKNVALLLPSLVVQPGSSLLSCESKLKTETNPQNNPQMNTIAILTVLDAPANEGDFRPPYIGAGNKALNWNKNDLDYTKLGSLANPGGTYPLETVAARFERPWIEINLTWAGRNMHPDLNQRSLDNGVGAYGRELANTIGAGLVALQLNYTDAEKETLLIRMVQYGIDVYGVAKMGGVWLNDGGHNMGRKMPMLLAGYMLDDENIMEYADGAKHPIFQEDHGMFYVSQKEVDQYIQISDGRARAIYTSDMIGMAEWGEKHRGTPTRDGSNWNAYYRDIAGTTMVAPAIAAHIMGLEEEWNSPHFFDYMDRLVGNQTPTFSPWGNNIPAFALNMWKAYRGMGSELSRGISLASDYIVYDRSQYTYDAGGKTSGVTEADLKDRKYTAAFTVTYTGEAASGDITMFVAEYDQEGTMVALTPKNVTCTKGIPLIIDQQFLLGTGSTYTVFLWETDSIVPLIKTRKL